MTPASVSLLLPNYNNERVLGAVLERLAANTTHPNVELIIVDDGSTDGSRRIIREWRDSKAFGGEVRLIETPNGGVTKSLNRALGASDGEFCVQLDSDASIDTPGWVERMLELMLLDDRVGAVGPKIVMDSGMLHACGIDIVGPAGVCDRPAWPIEPVGQRRWHHRVERVMEHAGGDAEHRVAEVDGLLGCCMMYRREDVVAAGGYDTGWTPLWFEDIDLCITLRRLGRKVFYLPDVHVTHLIHARQPAPPTAKQQRYRPARVARAAARRAARRLPPGARDRVEDRFGVDLDGHFTRDQLARFRRHYSYWREKWGWDFNNPDMAEIERRWGGTEICWASDPERRSVGAEIARAFERTRPAA